MLLTDVGSYFDHVQRMWEGYGCTARELLNQRMFEYETDASGQNTGRGHLIVELTFPGYEGGYLDVDDWLMPKMGHIRRQAFAYDLIYEGDRIENWHWHDGTYHRHDGRDRRPIARVTLEDAIEASYRILELVSSSELET